MSEKKQLNEEELKKVAAGLMGEQMCWVCNKPTRPRYIDEGEGPMGSRKCVCSICGTPYGEGFSGSR